MDRLTEMEAFATVVDQGGFTDAAKKLGISKSAVSKHVSSLEARLGARLLNRTTRRVSPTEIGRQSGVCVTTSGHCRAFQDPVNARNPTVNSGALSDTEAESTELATTDAVDFSSADVDVDADTIAVTGLTAGLEIVYQADSLPVGGLRSGATYYVVDAGSGERLNLRFLSQRE